MAENLVEIRDLVKQFPVKAGLLQRQVATVNAVAESISTSVKVKLSAWSASRVAARPPWVASWFVFSSRPQGPFVLTAKT